MKELLRLIKEHNGKALFLDGTDSAAVQFFRYLFVGGAATVADWFTLWFLHGLLSCGLYVATAAAFFIGLVVNYFLSIFFVFKNSTVITNRAAEFAVYLITGLIGLFITEALMYLFTDAVTLHYIPAKIIATAIVFIWNFGSKKVILYRKRDGK